MGLFDWLRDEFLFCLDEFFIKSNYVPVGLCRIHSFNLMAILCFLAILILSPISLYTQYINILAHTTYFLFEPISAKAPLKLLSSCIRTDLGINILEVFNIHLLGRNIFHFQLHLFVFIFWRLAMFLVFLQVRHHFMWNLISLWFLVQFQTYFFFWFYHNIVGEQTDELSEFRRLEFRRRLKGWISWSWL